MAKKVDQTASFMIRFNQKIFEDQGENKVQWRGKVSHVQGGEDKSFSDFKEAVAFIQEKLADLTIEASKGHPEEEQEGILKKSFSLWKTMAKEGPKVFMETIKDPRKKVDDLKDQIAEFGGEMIHKVPIDDWRSASKTDLKDIKHTLKELAGSLQKLNEKVDSLEQPKTKPKPKPAAKKAAKKSSVKAPSKITSKAKTTRKK